MIFQISEEEKKQKIKILSKMTLKLQGYGVANSILSIFFSNITILFYFLPLSNDFFKEKIWQRL